MTDLILVFQDGDEGRDLRARTYGVTKPGDPLGGRSLTKFGGGTSAFDFTKLDSEGYDLPPNAERWSCVRDNHTGLVWEAKTSDGALHDQQNTYTWFNPSRANYKGVENGGICLNHQCDTHNFALTVNRNGLCGATDWRLPNASELFDLMNNEDGYKMDTAYFPKTSVFSFWSSSAYNNQGYVVDFQSGIVINTSSSNRHGVRLVRTQFKY